MTQAVMSLLEAQVANLKDLSALLEQELHLISGRDAEALMGLLEDKSTRLEAIAKADAQIAAAYSSLPETEQTSTALQSQIDIAQELLEQCKYRTAINEKAVEQGQLKLSHLRNMLTESRAKESLTYDKKGKPNAGTLGKGVSA